MALFNVADLGKNVREIVKVSTATNSTILGGVMKGLFGSSIGSGVGLKLKGPAGMGIDFSVGSGLGAKSDSKVESESGLDVGNDADAGLGSGVGLKLKGPAGMGLDFGVGSALGAEVDSNLDLESDPVTDPNLDLDSEVELETKELV